MRHLWYFRTAPTHMLTDNENFYSLLDTSRSDDFTPPSKQLYLWVSDAGEGVQRRKNKGHRHLQFSGRKDPGGAGPVPGCAGPDAGGMSSVLSGKTGEAVL